MKVIEGILPSVIKPALKFSEAKIYFGKIFVREDMKLKDYLIVGLFGDYMILRDNGVLVTTKDCENNLRGWEETKWKLFEGTLSLSND
jgi:hypothetical protein